MAWATAELFGRVRAEMKCPTCGKEIGGATASVSEVYKSVRLVCLFLSLAGLVGLVYIVGDLYIDASKYPDAELRLQHFGDHAHSILLFALMFFVGALVPMCWRVCWPPRTK